MMMTRSALNLIAVVVIIIIIILNQQATDFIPNITSILC